MLLKQAFLLKPSSTEKQEKNLNKFVSKYSHSTKVKTLPQSNLITS